MNHPDRTSYTSKNAIDLSFPGRIPLWYEAKLLLVAWLVLPQFRGASFIYDKLVREQLRKHGLTAGGGKVKKDDKSPSSSPKDKEKPKSKFLAFVTPKKVT